MWRLPVVLKVYILINTWQILKVEEGRMQDGLFQQAKAILNKNFLLNGKVGWSLFSFELNDSLLYNGILICSLAERQEATST